jgi:cytochrome c oxidase subunit 2
LLAVAALALVATPVMAQEAPSTSARLINQLNGKLLYVGLPITLLVEVILIYTVWRFKDNDEPSPTKENRRLEISWTIATAIVLLFVGVTSYGVLANPNVTYPDTYETNEIPENAVIVHAEAYQWGWNMTYPEHNISTGNKIVIPKDRPVVFQVTSRDVIHSFHVPALGLKQDAVPGQTNNYKTVALKEGTYQGYCAEYCGVAHSKMYFTIEVMSQAEYQDWLQQQKQSQQGGSQGNSTATGNSTAGGNSSASLTTTQLIAAQSHA